MSIVFAVACGQFGFWLIWAVANRCRMSTACFLVAAVALFASGSALLIVEYVRTGGAWFMLVTPFVCFLLGLLFFHIKHWLYIEVWCRGQGVWYNLTKKKEAK